MEQNQPDLSVVFPLIDCPGPGLLSARLSFCLSIYWNVGRIKITGAVGTQGKHKERRCGGPHRGTNEDKAGAAKQHMEHGCADASKDNTNAERLFIMTLLVASISESSFEQFAASYSTRPTRLVQNYGQ